MSDAVAKLAAEQIGREIANAERELLALAESAVRRMEYAAKRMRDAVKDRDIQSVAMACQEANHDALGHHARALHRLVGLNRIATKEPTP